MSRHYPALERMVIRQLLAIRVRRRSMRWPLALFILVVGAAAVGGYVVLGRSSSFHVASVQSAAGAISPASRNLVYCGNNLLDLYPPRQRAFEKSPVVMYLHGGGWEKNNKQSEPSQLAMIDGLRDKGFAIVSINYRLLPDAPFPAALEDTLCAIRFLKAKASNYKLDKQKFALYGFSAGGHLASLIAALPANSQFNTGEYTEESSSVQAVVTLAGIFNLHDYIQPSTAMRAQALLAGQDAAVAEPATYLTPAAPPFLLIHGLQDQHVYMTQDDYFATKLGENGIYHEELRVANAGHGLEPLTGPIHPSEAVVNQRIADFITSQLLQ